MSLCRAYKRVEENLGGIGREKKESRSFDFTKSMNI